MKIISLEKENYDASDSLICALAFINVNRYGIEKPTIINSLIYKTENEIFNFTEINVSTKLHRIRTKLKEVLVGRGYYYGKK